MTDPVLAAAILAVVAGVTAALSPPAIATLPEPAQAHEDKPSYADLAATPGLGLRLGLAAAVTGAVVGARLGLGQALVVWCVLVPVFVVLAWIDWRTRYLPTRLIAPTYVAVVALIVTLAWLPGGGGSADLKGPLVGWLVIGGGYLLLWLVYPKGLGYGDVRLSGLLGLGLGMVGVSEVVVGAYAGFLLGAIGGLLLQRRGLVKRKAYPFGPFMVAGAVLAILVGPQITTALGY